jgi:hypothetical protein
MYGFRHMTIPEFIAKWRKVELKERSAAQEHFIDLCNAFDQPTPAAADPAGVNFCFEKGAAKHGGGDGFADVWKRGFFGWEYKGKHKDLSVAYDQLLRYRNALENPPLLVVCDLDRIIVHTNFTGTVSVANVILLESLGEPRNIEILRAVFHNPEALRPGRTSAAVTQDAARHFAVIAAAMRERGLDSAVVAHFLDRLVFCLFSEDVRLLPDMVFTRIVEKSGGDPARFCKILGQLFDTMATGGDFGLERIRHFNGNLFDDRTVPELTADEMKRIAAAADLDWSAVDPSIFGTLFERGLDPAKRAQLGAHFTSREDIELVVDAVIMTVLRREWDAARAVIECLLTTGRKAPAASKSPAKALSATAVKKAAGEASSLLHGFLVRLQHVKILDPACGSGNFLYVALLRLKDLEKEVILFGNDNGLGSFLPMVGPSQLYGIEINPYAHDLAQMTVWIGWLQWIRANGFGFPADPILRPLTENIRLMDAIIGENGEPEWPTVDFIIGNPPFLGNKRLRSELGTDYCATLFSLYGDRLPATSDLCCYWFEKARAHIAAGKCVRVGLLATTSSKQVSSRTAFERIGADGRIFFAISDHDWFDSGAAVRICIVGFGSKAIEDQPVLDGKPVDHINADLTAGNDLTQKLYLDANKRRCFMGTTKVGDFDIPFECAREMLTAPNPHGRPNSDVLRPFKNGSDLVRADSQRWIVDFGTNTKESEAALYETPFGYLVATVKPVRILNKRQTRAERWWLLGETIPAFRKTVALLARYLATPRVSKHRVFVWLDTVVLPDSKVLAIAFDDLFHFGVLQSRIHEMWSLATCGWHGVGNDATYNPTECFETFPFPVPTNEQRTAIESAARALNELRENWLNPPEWTREELLEFPGTVGGPWDRYIDPATVTDRGAFKVGTVRYPRIVARDTECASRLKDRTLTKLYNARPAWLAACHAKLDAAVAAAYGWNPNLPDEQVLANLLNLNLSQSQTRIIK